MGLDASHLHIRDVALEDVVRVIRSEYPRLHAIVTPNVNGWVTVLTGSEPEIGGTLCRVCERPGLVLTLARSSVLGYHVFDAAGERVSHCDHTSDESTELTAEQVAGLDGNLAAFSKTLHVPEHNLRSVLANEHVFRDDNLWALCDLLGIKTAGCSFWDFDDVADESIMGEWAGFVRVTPSA